MKEITELIQDVQDYITWIKQTFDSRAINQCHFSKENIRHLLTGVLDYDPAEEIVAVELIDTPPAKTDPMVKFLFVCGDSSLTDNNLDRAGRMALSYGSNLFFYSTGPDIKVVNVEMENGVPELEVMMEIDLLADDPTEIATTLWPLCKKDCGKRVLVATLGENHERPSR